jgi:hypothetical protein
MKLNAIHHKVLYSFYTYGLVVKNGNRVEWLVIISKARCSPPRSTLAEVAGLHLQCDHVQLRSSTEVELKILIVDSGKTTHSVTGYSISIPGGFTGLCSYVVSRALPYFHASRRLLTLLAHRMRYIFHATMLFCTIAQQIGIILPQSTSTLWSPFILKAASTSRLVLSVV